MMTPNKELTRSCSFEGQDADEEILYVIHRHWFNIFVQFIPFIIGLFVVLSTFVFFSFIYPDAFVTIDRRLFAFVESMLLIFLWLFAFLIWIDYYLDVWIITTKRIVNIEQKGLFVRSMSELYLFRVQDTTSEVKGFFPSMLNYGDVFIQSAGEQERFQFHKIPDPYGVKDTIMDMARDTHQEEIEFMEENFQHQGSQKKSVGKKEIAPTS
ncbi:MAG: PH domain-containing protein [Candidatus Moraniibacteriota bacterium]|nr:MAG: PH domain-containing protein [Candidatus Moranbacteria bacterium]